jgi:hypothetical protein
VSAGYTVTLTIGVIEDRKEDKIKKKKPGRKMSDHPSTIFADVYIYLSFL